MNCGYGRGFSVLEVLDCVDRVTNLHDRAAADAAPRRRSARAGRRQWPDPRDPALAARRATISTRSSPTRWPGSASWLRANKFRQSLSAHWTGHCRRAARARSAAMQSSPVRRSGVEPRCRFWSFWPAHDSKNQGDLRHENHLHCPSCCRSGLARRLRWRRRQQCRDCQQQSSRRCRPSTNVGDLNAPAPADLNARQRRRHQRRRATPPRRTAPATRSRLSTPLRSP